MGLRGLIRELIIHFCKIEENQGIKIACLEEVAYRMGFVTKENLLKITEKYPNNDYFNYVKEMLNK